MTEKNISRAFLLSVLFLSFTACTEHSKEIKCDGYYLIEQEGGTTLGYSPKSGIQILSVDDWKFKDLNKNGKLDKYEDWRLSMEERALDLADQLTLKDIAGLMLYSSHQGIPADKRGKSTYNGKPFAESGCQPWELSDLQRKFLKDDNLRHVLITSIASPEVAARWNNEVQAYVEGLGFGIPANNSSDPRHNPQKDSEFNAGAGGLISLWPRQLGLAASFDSSLVKKFGKIASAEYRALGIATTLSPQVDIATDPRWFRYNGTFGEDSQLSADLARAYCDGFQTSTGTAEIANGWGYQSVNAMVKHWPGGGACEAGRDAHYGSGKYAVFPNKQMNLHKFPFVEGAFKLEGPTQQASCIMPYYTITYGQGETVGNSFNQDVITRQLREEHRFEGVVCTDWGITANEKHPGVHSGKPWGVEKLTVAERHYKALMAGVDQYGGNNVIQPILEAYEMGVKEHGEEWMKARMARSAYRLLMNIFRVGLFDNPYVDPVKTSKIVGCEEFAKEGYLAQIKSTVMVKNAKNLLPLKNVKKVYIPQRSVPKHLDFWKKNKKAFVETPIEKSVVEKYYSQVDNTMEADFAVVFIESPIVCSGYDNNDLKKGGNGYVPITLQYNDYVATEARKVSIAGGDPYENFTNRSYRGKKVSTVNKGDMELVIATKKQMGDKPVIVAVTTNNPFVMSEIEPYADAIFLTFDVEKQVILDLISGKYEPSGLLPMQMPADMVTVEHQFEDTPHDMECYKDSEGHTYDFAYGMNWSGVIKDERVARYARK